MNWQSVTLNLSDQEIQALKQQNARIIQHLEEGYPLKPELLAGLKQELTAVINKNTDFRKVMERIANSGEHYVVQLFHKDNEILNLPWSIAVDELTQQALGSIERLYLTKCLPDFMKGNTGLYQPKAAAPLKVLLMISSPEDSGWKSVLSYDEEEYENLKAFTPLIQTGAVEIDFTDDGSLETLKTKLKTNKYHILHFSGHGEYQDGKGHLALENPINLETELVTAREFA